MSDKRRARGSQEAPVTGLPARDSKDLLRVRYESEITGYERLAVNLQQALISFLQLNDIPHLSVSYRIKTFDSAFEKIGRKAYVTPFEQMEDICGIRIICFYPTDIERISAVIEREFHVLEEQNKSLLLGVNEFGYRSVHYVVKVPEEWLVAPNYRGLDDLKAEVQIRTILMHAWAEIEHKLAYKSEEQIPPEFRRKLYRLSAKFEETDEQFEELRTALAGYRSDIRARAEKSGRFDERLPLNLDSLRALLDFYFPDRSRDIGDIRDLLQELNERKFTMQRLVSGINTALPFLLAAEKEAHHYTPFYTQTGALRFALMLWDKEYHESFLANWSAEDLADIDTTYRDTVIKWARRLKDST